jgi:folate-binding protein YgfZ
MDSENVLLGIGGTKAPTILEKWFNLPEPMHITEDNMGTLLRHPDALEVPFFQWLIPSQQLNQILPELSHVLSMGSEATWDLSRIYAGIPQIELATQEQFVPQSVNLELIHGVSFKKGCYPGQEIVARMHYLGKPKRRMLCATIHTPHAAPSMEVYSANDPSQPCGMIVNAEKNTDNEFICLVEIQLSALQHDIFLGSTAREQLHFHNLPYEISNE